MSDVVERAEAALEGARAPGGMNRVNADLLAAVVAELKAARAEVEQWRSLWRQNTTTASEAMAERDQALAENERLSAEVERLRAVMPPCTCPGSSIFTGQPARDCAAHGDAR